MFVKIGPHKNWYGPYQLAETLMFWKPKHDGTVHRFGHWLAGSVATEGDDWAAETHTSWLYRAMNWIHKHQERAVRVRIDKYDTWNMDSTLCYIILPMLRQLKATKHGAPCVDDTDVPEELRSSSAAPKENEWDVDGNHFKRWDWVLDQMIWSFQQQHPNCDWEAQFHSGVNDFYFEKQPDSNFSTLATGANHTAVFDREGYSAHSQRIDEGLRLFGKYYRALWD